MNDDAPDVGEDVGEDVREALVLMARAPVEGQVKTRLVGPFTPPEVLELYLNFLRDTFAMMEEVQSERDDLALVLCYTPEEAVEAFEEVEREGCLMMAQRGADLGERISNCLKDLFDNGYDRVVVIGADTPALPSEYIVDAFDDLEGRDSIVIGPALDQGYYLIGMCQYLPILFRDITWGTASVLPLTRERIAAAGLELTELPEFVDVDTIEDLDLLEQVFAEDQSLAPKTRRYLKSLRKSRV